MASGITHDNFYISTHGTFVECKHPNSKPDFVTLNKKTKKAQSLYWYGSDEGGDYVIRKSDHWCILKNETTGLVDKHLKFIKDCRWHICYYTTSYTRQYRNKISSKRHFLIGKIYLKQLSKRK